MKTPRLVAIAPSTAAPVAASAAAPGPGVPKGVALAPTPPAAVPTAAPPAKPAEKDAPPAPAAAPPVPQATPPVVPGSRGGSSSGASSSAVQLATTVETASHFDLVRVAGDDTGGTALGASATTASFREIAGVVRAADGTIYLCDAGAHQLRAIPPAGATQLVAGLAVASAGFNADGSDGPSTQLSSPHGLVRDARTGTLFFCDTGNDRIRFLVPGGQVGTLAGGGGDAGDAVARATDARLEAPWGLAADGQGNLLFTERDSGRVRRITRAGALETLATLTAGAVGPIAVDSAGTRIWVGDGAQVRLIDTLANPALQAAAVLDAGTDEVVGLAFDQVATLYAVRTTAGGRAGVRVVRQAVAERGEAQAGRAAEAIAGTGGDSNDPAAYSAPTTARANALDQLLAGAGGVMLAIDLEGIDDPNVPAGDLYLGHSFFDAGSGTRWSQLLRLRPQE